jgi:hypothetical protein
VTQGKGRQNLSSALPLFGRSEEVLPTSIVARASPRINKRWAKVSYSGSFAPLGSRFGQADGAQETNEVDAELSTHPFVSAFPTDAV